MLDCAHGWFLCDLNVESINCDGVVCLMLSFLLAIVCRMLDGRHVRSGHVLNLQRRTRLLSSSVDNRRLLRNNGRIFDVRDISILIIILFIVIGRSCVDLACPGSILVSGVVSGATNWAMCPVVT